MRLKCRLEAELKAKKDAELRAKAKLERDRLERGQADELAGAMNEFFTALYTENDAPAPDMSSYITSFTDLPLSSPDSITVTTEFGVLEETGNVTIISAGGATHPYDDADEDEEYDDEPSYHHDEDPESYVIHTEDTSSIPGPVTGSTDWVTAVALQHQQEQNMWLLQQQMQMHSVYNLHANVAMGSNTTPPLTQHMAPVVHHLEGEVEEESGGEEADVDTDEVLEDGEDEDVEGTATPTVVAGGLN